MDGGIVYGKDLVGSETLLNAASGIYRALASLPKFAIARAPVLYAIGSLVAYWSIGRIVGILA